MWNNGSLRSNKREMWLDIAKCFGILLVILNHLGKKIPIVTFFGGMFYMPLFFVAAGYTYRKKEERYSTYILGKAKRLLIPYAVCNLFLVALFTVRSGFSKPSLLGIFYSRNMLMKPTSEWNMGLMTILNAPTWFLTCLFLCLCIYAGIDRIAETAKKRRILVVIGMAVGIFLQYVSPVLLPWSLENALYFLGLIELGRFLKESGLEWLRKNEWIYGNILILFVALSYGNGSVNVSIDQYGRSMILYFFTGALGSLLCMKAAELTEQYGKVLAKPLAFVGRHTLTILCWHLFAIEVITKLVHLF